MPLDPEIVPILEFFKELGMPDPATAKPEDMRAAMGAMPVENPTAVAAVEDRTLAGPGGDLLVRIYRPEGDGPAPLTNQPANRTHGSRTPYSTRRRLI